MKSSVFSFRQRLPETGSFFIKMKTLRNSKSRRIYYSALKLWTRVLLSNVYKHICGIYFIFLQSEDIEKYVKRLRVSHGLLNTLPYRSMSNNTTSNHLLKYNVKSLLGQY